MSAFQVHPNHIGAILRWYLFDQAHDSMRGQWRGHRPTTEDAVDMAACLTFECHKSVSYRYPNHAGELPGPIEFQDCPVICDTENLGIYKALSAAGVIKACHCLRYQSCEHPSFETSEAKRLLDEIIETAVHKMPGYADAEWEVTERAPNVTISLFDLARRARKQGGV